MNKPTFEQALRQTLANSALAQAIENEDPPHKWHMGWVEDIQAVEKVVDNLCEDLSKITGRPIRRFTKLRANVIVMGGSYADRAEYSYKQMTKVIKSFISSVIDNIRCNPHEAPIYYPIHAIRWSKGNVQTCLPDDKTDTLKGIKLSEPTYKDCSEVEIPAHIHDILKRSQDTHYDYQIFVLEDGVYQYSKVLGIRLGCDWPDFAVATWDPRTWWDFDKTMTLGAALTFMLAVLGCFAASRIETNWISVFVLVAAILSGAIGGLLSTLLVAKTLKTLRL